MPVYHSIFNDVLGPIMAGPSSSHSAGCARIGLLTRLLFGREICHAEVVFDQKGSYPSTYIGQGSNFGFTGGLLGLTTDHPELKNAVGLAKAAGKRIHFSQADLPGGHPNEARIDVYDAQDRPELSVLTHSTGGGTFKILEMDGFAVDLDGSREVWFLYFDAACRAEIERAVQHIGHRIQVIGETGLLTLFEPMDTSLLPSIRKTRRAPVILPVGLKADAAPPFKNAAEALDYMDKNSRPLWQAAIDYECAIGHVTPDEVLALTDRVLDTMLASMTPPDPERTPKYGFLDYQAMRMTASTAPTAPVGILNQAALDAIAVMENSCAHNTIVAAPTAGSSGVIPAAVLRTGLAMGKPRADLQKALLACGLVGAFIANDATFGAEVAGCQAETGAAACMAAAGTAELLGGRPAQCFSAASMALQNLLGLICDPVGGLTEIPCISRNVSAAGCAVLAANMTLLGFDAVIPLDETIETMYRVGRQLPASLRCTCRGGLCTTCTGQRLQREIDGTRPVL